MNMDDKDIMVRDMDDMGKRTCSIGHRPKPTNSTTEKQSTCPLPSIWVGLPASVGVGIAVPTVDMSVE